MSGNEREHFVNKLKQASENAECSSGSNSIEEVEDESKNIEYSDSDSNSDDTVRLYLEEEEDKETEPEYIYVTDQEKEDEADLTKVSKELLLSSISVSASTSIVTSTSTSTSLLHKHQYQNPQELDPPSPSLSLPLTLSLPLPYQHFNSSLYNYFQFHQFKEVSPLPLPFVFPIIPIPPAPSSTVVNNINFDNNLIITSAPVPILNVNVFKDTDITESGDYIQHGSTCDVTRRHSSSNLLFTCTICSNLYKCLTNLRIHYKRVHQVSLCKYCAKCFPLDEKEKFKSKNSKHEMVCPAKCSSKTSKLNYNLAPQFVRETKCDYCNYKSKYGYYALARHMQRCHNDKLFNSNSNDNDNCKITEFPCTFVFAHDNKVCQKKYGSSANLRSHYRDKHESAYCNRIGCKMYFPFANRHQHMLDYHPDRM